MVESEDKFGYKYLIKLYNSIYQYVYKLPNEDFLYDSFSFKNAFLKKMYFITYEITDIKIEIEKALKLKNSVNLKSYNYDIQSIIKKMYPNLKFITQDKRLPKNFSYLNAYNYKFAKDFNQLLSQTSLIIHNKVLLYGDGSVSTLITHLFPNNVIAIIDKNIKREKNNKIPIISPNQIKDFTFDKILITVMGREKEIYNYLTEDLKIDSNKIDFYNFEMNYNKTEISKSEIQMKKFDYIFIVTHKKFIIYLENIFLQVPNSAFLIINHSNEAINYCKEKSFNYLLTNLDIHCKTPINDNIKDLINVYLQGKKLIGFIQPKKMIIVEGSAESDEIYNIIGKYYNIPTICIQQGWSPLPHLGYKDMTFSKFLTWGEEFSKLFLKENHLQNFKAVGAHNLNPKVLKKNNQTITIFHHGLPNICNTVSIDQLNEFEDFIYEICKKFPSKDFIMREHPSSPIRDSSIDKFRNIKNLTFMNPNKFTLDEVFIKTDISIAIYSTTIIESIAYNIIPIIFNNTIPNYEPNLQEKGLAIEVKNTEEGIEKLDRLINDKSYFNNFQNQIKKFKFLYYKCYGNDAIKNIIKEIL